MKSFRALYLMTALAACTGDDSAIDDDDAGGELPLGDVSADDMKADGNWGAALTCKPVPDLPQLRNAKITLSIDGLTLHLTGDGAGREDRTRGLADAGDRIDLPEQRGAEGGCAAVLLLDLLPGGDRDVDVLVRLGEDLLEGGVGRIRQHVGAGDQRDAEDDGEGRHEGAPLAAPEVLEGEAKQGS